MMSGKSLAALIALLTMPIIARLFTPEHFGVAAVFMSIVGVVSSVGTLRYAAAIVLPKDESEAIDIMALAYRISLAICTLVLVSLFAYSLAEVPWSLLEVLGSWMWFLPVGIFLFTSVHINDAWLVRLKSFKRASASIVAGNAATGALRIAFGAAFGSTIPGLVFGYLLGLVARLAAQGGFATAGFRKSVTDFNAGRMRIIAARYSDFPRLNAPAGLISGFGHHLPVIMFGAMFSPVVAGLYAMADRLAKVPVTVVATSIRRVFLQKTAGIQQDGRSLKKAFLLTVGVLACLGLLPFGLVWQFGQEMAVIILGDNWSGAGAYLEIMSPWLFIVWVAAPCNSVFIVLRQQKVWLSLQVGLVLVQSAAFALAFFTDTSAERTLQAFVAATVFMNLVIIAMSLILIIRHDRKAGFQSAPDTVQ
jgi:O-antigen/teichoic acid export membrane protein